MTATIHRLPPIRFIVEQRWNPHWGRTGQLIVWLNHGRVLTVLDGDRAQTTILQRSVLTIFARPPRTRSAVPARHPTTPRHSGAPSPDGGLNPMAA